MKLALCIVGCGQYARTFAQNLAPLHNKVELYFASRDLQRAQVYCQELGGAGAYGSYSAAAADPRIDAMYVCTPHHLHLEHVSLAAQAGKQVLVEKPIARTLEEADQIINTAQQSGVTLMVAEQIRFMATVRRCQQLVKDGVIGDLRLVQLQEEAPFQPGGWRSSRELNGGGVFIDGGIHKVHFLRYLLGEPEHVYAVAFPPAIVDNQGEDGLVLVGRWANGAVGLINHSWTAVERPGARWVSVSGTQGRIYFEFGASWLRLERDGREETIQCSGDASGHANLVREFYQSIREMREPETSGEEGRRDLALVLKAYQSMEQGSSVALT